ncbi:MAG: hypothetical protein Q4A62_10565 [Eikenella sp.]|nr:hypothetical protein [Eikenella sp.]
MGLSFLNKAETGKIVGRYCTPEAGFQVAFASSESLASPWVFSVFHFSATFTTPARPLAPPNGAGFSGEKAALGAQRLAAFSPEKPVQKGQFAQQTGNRGRLSLLTFFGGAKKVSGRVTAGNPRGTAMKRKAECLSQNNQP